MSSGSQDKRVDLLAGFARELRQFHGLGASFFRAAAGRIKMTVTDMQVIDILDTMGPATAGQLADLTGLTTGAITGMINRLEEAGFVSRERDPIDGRRVIVRLASDKDVTRELGRTFASLGNAWDDLASQYDDEEITLLLEFLKRSNAISRNELIRLREAPTGEAGTFAPLGDLERGRLVISSEGTRLTMRTGRGLAELYQARFEGPVPDVKVKDGVVNVRYPRIRWILGGKEKRVADVALNDAVPWEIEVQGGGSQIGALLGGLDLVGLEVKGGGSEIRLELPLPSRVVPIRVSGGGSSITLRRPAGVAARVHLKGWGSMCVFDDQTFSSMGSAAQLESPGYDGSGPCYDIEVDSSGSMVNITAG